MTGPLIRDRRLSALAAGALAVALSGCVVGPNYRGPPPVAPRAEAAPAFHRAEDVSAAEPVASWWLSLNDAELDRLMSVALASNPDLEVARARILQSRAQLTTARANRLPTTQATAAYLRTRGANTFLTGGAATVTGTTGAPAAANTDDIFEFSNVGGIASWEPDFFGGQARAIEDAKARAQAFAADLEAAQVSLTAEVAQAYVSLRDLQTRLALTRRDSDTQLQMLTALQTRQAGGTASTLDVERLNDQLQTTRAEVAPLQAQITEQMDRLSLLTGQEPGALDAQLSAAAALPAPPASVAVGDPAALLRRRPDIRAAERRLAASNAVIGERTADLFPKVTILGNIGFGSSTGSDLFNAGSFTYAIAPFLQWKPFDFGRVRASIDLAKGQNAEMVADYRRTVLSALEDAESSLSRYARQRERVRSLIRVQDSADRVARLTALRVQGGTAATIDVLDAERQRLSAEAATTSGMAQLTLDYVTLQKSLGLGWRTAETP